MINEIMSQNDLDHLVYFLNVFIVMTIVITHTGMMSHIIGCGSQIAPLVEHDGH